MGLHAQLKVPYLNRRRNGICPQKTGHKTFVKAARSFGKSEAYQSSKLKPRNPSSISKYLSIYLQNYGTCNLASNLMKHLQSEYILYEWQHVFRSKRATDTQLLTLVHELSHNLDRKNTYSYP